LLQPSSGTSPEIAVAAPSDILDADREDARTGRAVSIGPRGAIMTAYNVVRFRTKPGQEQEFEDRFRGLPRSFEGLRKFALIKTGEGAYCSIGEWESYDDMVAARPLMITNLDKFRHTLAEFGDGRDITDAVSGDAIYEIHHQGGGSGT